MSRKFKVKNVVSLTVSHYFVEDEILIVASDWPFLDKGVEEENGWWDFSNFWDFFIFFSDEFDLSLLKKFGSKLFRRESWGEPEKKEK